MRRLLLGTALAAGLAAPVRAEEGIPRDTLAALKAATVFVNVETTRGYGSGSGFLVGTTIPPGNLPEQMRPDVGRARGWLI